MLLRLLRAPFRLLFLYWLVYGGIGMLTVLGSALRDRIANGDAFMRTSATDFGLAFVYAPLNGLRLLVGAIMGEPSASTTQSATLFTLTAFLVLAFIGMVFNSGSLVFLAVLIPLLYTLYELQAWQWLTMI